MHPPYSPDLVPSDYHLFPPLFVNCEAGRTETPLEVLEPLEDELSLALSSLPFPDSDITLSDLEDADVTVLEAGEPVSSNAEGSPN